MFGGLLLLLVVICFIALLWLLLPWKVLVLLAAILVACLVVFYAVGFIIPFNPEDVIRREAEEVISEQDRVLLRLALDDDSRQEDLDAFLANWDIEEAPIKSVLLVAYVMKTRTDLKFPSSITPRLNGVLSFCKFQNLKREAHFSKICGALAKENIPCIILKGGAMKVYRPEFPRWMNDIDMLVPSEDYDRAVDIAVSLGYSSSMCTDHSVDLHHPDSDEGLLDIHKHLEMFTGKEEALNEGLFARSSARHFFMTDGRVPSPEDMVFISLVNLYKNLAKKQTPESSLTTFYDLKYLTRLNPVFDWEVVKNNCELSDASFQVIFSSMIVESVVSDVFPEGWRSSMPISDKEFKKQLVDFLFRKDVLSSSRDSFGETAVGQSLSNDWNILVFMWVAFVEFIKKAFCNSHLKYSFWRIHQLLH